jgi:large repetitive protein
MGTLSGTDIEGTPLTYILNTNVTQGVLTLSSTGAFTYTPSVNYNGSDSFTFHVSDGVNNSLVVTGSISITAVNDLPVAISDTATGTEDTVLVISPVTNDTDVEGGALTLSTFTNGSNGVVTASGNSLVYTPAANACGADTVNYSVTDPLGGLSNTGTISVSLVCVNDVPVASNDTATGTEDTPLMIAVLNNDTDVENNTLSVTALTQPASGGSVAVVGTGVVFTPTANACSPNPVTFTYQARDTSLALSAVTTVTISAVTCMNDAPVSLPSSYSVTGNMVISSGTTLSGGSLTGYLETNNSLTRSLTATDVDSVGLIFTLATPVVHGTGVLSSTGLLVYIPALGYVGSDTFTYTVTDGIATTGPIIVTITVIDPHPPVISMTPTGSVGGPGGGGG